MKIRLLTCAALGSALLAGCSGPVAPAPAQSAAGTPSQVASGKPLPEPTVTGVEASMVIASVDVDAQNATVSGYVSGVVEEGGDCVFVLTPSGGQPVSRTVAGKADRDTTSCATQVPVSDLRRGSWSVVLTYTDRAGASVASSPMALEVP